MTTMTAEAIVAQREATAREAAVREAQAELDAAAAAEAQHRQTEAALADLRRHSATLADTFIAKGKELRAALPPLRILLEELRVVAEESTGIAGQARRLAPGGSGVKVLYSQDALELSKDLRNLADLAARLAEGPNPYSGLAGTNVPLRE